MTPCCLTRGYEPSWRWSVLLWNVDRHLHTALRHILTLWYHQPLDLLDGVFPSGFPIRLMCISHVSIRNNVRRKGSVYRLGGSSLCTFVQLSSKQFVDFFTPLNEMLPRTAFSQHSSVVIRLAKRTILWSIYPLLLSKTPSSNAIMYPTIVVWRVYRTMQW